MPEPVAWTLPSDSNARGRCVASKRFGRTTPDPPRREALVNHGFSNGFSGDFQWIFNGKPWIFHHFNGFSNDFPMIFKEKSEPETMDVPMKYGDSSIFYLTLNQSIEQ